MLSKIINLLRFPLSFLIVLLHSNCITNNGYHYDTGIGDFFMVCFTNGICQVAIPAFAFISGYLFFNHFSTWDYNTYKTKIKKRFYSLFIPYMTWNIIAFLWIVFYQSILNIFKHTNFDIIEIFHSVGGIRLFWDTYDTMPLDGPLWYIRDLIFVVLLSPIIMLFIKKTKLWGMILFTCFFLANIWHPFVHHPSQKMVVYFFTLGAYFHLENIDFLLLFRNNHLIIYVFSILSLLTMIFTFGYNAYFYRLANDLFTIFGCAAIICLADVIVKKYNTNIIPSYYSDSSFFIYAAHRFAIIDIISSLYSVIFPVNNQAQLAIKYFTIAILTTYICLFLFLLLKQKFPKFLSYINGGR